MNEFEMYYRISASFASRTTVLCDQLEIMQPRHPNKEIEAALEYARRMHGWTYFTMNETVDAHVYGKSFLAGQIPFFEALKLWRLDKRRKLRINSHAF